VNGTQQQPAALKGGTAVFTMYYKRQIFIVRKIFIVKFHISYIRKIFIVKFHISYIRKIFIVKFHMNVRNLASGGI
jgi:hypothetical protein